MLEESIKYIKNWTGATRPPPEGGSGRVLLTSPAPCRADPAWVSACSPRVAAPGSCGKTWEGRPGVPLGKLSPGRGRPQLWQRRACPQGRGEASEPTYGRRAGTPAAATLD